ncbi:hypothetical protein IC229_19115 [Spirosoma sp. BT702]|uniref:Uncharacterized protein n=1 Tax=Spirosoma profusum TaxID=2771354 RepID=A0A926XYX8_9BACT|nr:hypothetical protein [Spirosoma profusum]MBD2702766.1 hypothetical protein [Spirosoma profusum]
MEDKDNPINIDEVKNLRERIRTKYDTYYKRDKVRFPTIDYNTNRGNYEPLRQSFVEEFYVVRGIDRVDNNLHIPSTNTLALLFTDDNYLPGKKILNTCRSYAEGKSTVIADTRNQPDSQTKTSPDTANRKLFMAGFIFLTGLVVYGIIKYLFPSRASDLVIHTPHNAETVPRIVAIEGNVSNADSVWVVVHPISWNRSYEPDGGWNKYFIQAPVKVESNGTWKCVLYIGSTNAGEAGVKWQIRAFVNPEQDYKSLYTSSDLYHQWPKAELSTQAIEVTRGPKNE